MWVVLATYCARFGVVVIVSIGDAMFWTTTRVVLGSGWALKIGLQTKIQRMGFD